MMHGTTKVRNREAIAGKDRTWEEEILNAVFVENFMDFFEPAIDYLGKNKVKLTVRAKSYELKMVWIEGDNATGIVRRRWKGQGVPQPDAQ
ncbi:hypothetical protein F503_01982 [Ophiostoma piceae UAMH 11346]|uniref:Uncharacterized protein n=1 Tax=Ophiostoma piceae (strain UAMH 11346) TaxID=1262450 RepID=S3BPN6_OPHP1|nr:hypothetical protein F503_01982 [Ophiostoma piceae UAMH 11346]